MIARPSTRSRVAGTTFQAGEPSWFPGLIRLISLIGLIRLIGPTFLSTAAAAPFPEPDGWEQARFGMALEEFTRAYPRATPLDPPTSDGAQLALRRFELPGQKFGTLRNCTLQFHFSGRPAVLFRIEGRCPQPGEEMARYFEATYGPPTRIGGNTLHWVGKEVEINFVPQGQSFSLNDIARSRSFIGALMKMLGQLPLAPTAAPTPAVEP